MTRVRGTEVERRPAGSPQSCHMSPAQAQDAQSEHSQYQGSSRALSLLLDGWDAYHASSRLNPRAGMAGTCLLPHNGSLPPLTALCCGVRKLLTQRLPSKTRIEGMRKRLARLPKQRISGRPEARPLKLFTEEC